MCDGKTVDIINLLDCDVEAAVEYCYFWRSCDKLDEGIHQFLVETLNNAPEPFNHWGLLRVALVFSFAD
jgi:hypothetical protein